MLLFFKHFYIQGELKKEDILICRILEQQSAEDGASQNFSFKGSLHFGGIFKGNIIFIFNT
jgi:hypothetical protein